MDAVQELNNRLRQLGDLTPRERQTAALRSVGKSLEEIADTLVITPRTVRFHLDNVYKKLGIPDRNPYQRLRAIGLYAGALEQFAREGGIPVPTQPTPQEAIQEESVVTDVAPEVQALMLREDALLVQNGGVLPLTIPDPAQQLGGSGGGAMERYRRQYPEPITTQRRSSRWWLVALLAASAVGGGTFMFIMRPVLEKPGPPAFAADGSTSTPTQTTTPIPISTSAPPITVTTATAAPSATPRPSNTPQPTATSTPKAGDELYAVTSWPGGLSGWSGNTDWKTAGGMLVYSSENQLGGGVIWAPYRPPTSDYAVEAEIQIISDPNCCDGFGVIVRGTGNGEINAYRGGVGHGGDSGPYGAVLIAGDPFHCCLRHQAFSPGKGWHKYRLEVKANQLRLFIDDAPAGEAVDNRFLSGQLVGLWTNTSPQVNVRSFRVFQL